MRRSIPPRGGGAWTLDADLIAVGRKDRLAVRAKTGHPLPCAVLNAAAATVAMQRRKSTARKLGIDWIDVVGDWPIRVQSWLAEASSQNELATPLALRQTLEEQFQDDQSASTTEFQIDLPNSEYSEHDVFLSYAREDIDKARHIARQLKNKGYSVFWDAEILPGDQWRETIFKILGRAKCVVVAWSKHSIQSRWVISEAEAGMRQNKLLAILFDRVEPPFGYGEIQAADLTHSKPSPRSEPFQSLLKAIAGRTRSR